MAHEWFVQHGGKQHGPLNSATLKKLAAEGKISPTTQVRLGATGAWVPASRVQGLFAAPTKPASAPSPPPELPPAAPPPIAPPVARPMGTPVPRPALGSFIPQAKPAPPAAHPIAAKLIGAVALVLGTLALSVFWLPVMGPLGWLGIAVGGLGLVLGIVGFVVSAKQQGLGLSLNIAGTSSSLVGLVLTVVFGVMFGMFGGREPQTPPVVAAAAALPPVAVLAPEPKPAPVETPTPPPEPVWTDAGQELEQGPIKARIAAAKIEMVRLESIDLSTLKPSKPQPMLKIVLALENTTSDRIVEVSGWPGSADMIGQGVGELLGGEAGQALKTATASARLLDNVGNTYKQVPQMSLFGAKVSLGADQSLRPGQTRQIELVFQPPLSSIEYLRIELAPAGFAGQEPLRFQIPRALVTGLPEAPASPQ